MPWDARLGLVKQKVPMESILKDGRRVVEIKHVSRYFVALTSPSGASLLFPITKRGNTFTLRDERESFTGSQGSTGLWGTGKAGRSGEAKPLTPTAWKAEVSHLIGSVRAEEVIQEYLACFAEARAEWEAKQRATKAIRRK